MQDYGKKVRAMLAQAESLRKMGNDVAADNAEAMAFRILRDYGIDLENAMATDQAVESPTYVVIDVRNLGRFAYRMSLMADMIASHAGVRIDDTRAWIGEGSAKERVMRLTVVGFELDLRYFEYLWTSAHLMFVTRVDPRWDDALPEELNIFRMRQAGIERKHIADRAWGHGAGAEAKNRSKVQRIYVKQCEIHGERAGATGLGFNAKDYREAYADAFTSRLRRRLRQAQNAADSTGGGLVLHNRQAKIDAEFDRLFPPAPKTEVAPYVAPNTTCQRCAKAASGYCREHGYLRPRAWTKAELERADRRLNGASAVAGELAGGRAADSVNISRGTTPRTDRIDSGQRSLGN